MEYRNIKTGAIIDVNSEIQGTDWEPVKKAEKVKEVPAKKAPAKKGSKK